MNQKNQKFRFWTKRPANNKKKNNNETPSLDLALRAGKNTLGFKDNIY